MEDLSKLLKDLTNYDPHIRQNAVRFLSQQYLDDNKRNALKEDDKAKIVTGLLSRLEQNEESLEVKGCTVKNFGLISKYLKENEIIQIFSKIITYITDPKAVGKDIYVTCIKAILKEMSGSSCYTVGKVMIPEIIKGIQSSNIEIKELCFDTFNDYILTFNYVLIKESESVIKNKDAIFAIAIDTIHVDNQSLRNRISNFLGNFSVILNKSQIASLLEGLISKIKKSENIPEKITLLTTLNSVAKNTATRHGEYLKHIIPLIYEFCNKEYLEKNSADYDLNNDLVECGLAVLETYIIKLTNLMKGETDNICKIALELMEYDPNFVYSEEGEEAMDYGDYANEYEGYEGYEAFVFGDDSSWKVRRAAVRVIQSFVKSRMELPRELVELIIQSLVFNLREHEENTKLDIISCLSSFLRNLVIEDESGLSPGEDLGLVKQKSITNFIPMIIKKLVDGIVKELKSNNQKVKGTILQLLSSLALVDPVDLILNFEEIKPHLESSLKENISALTFFVFLSRLLKSLKNCSEVSPYFEDFIKWIISGLKNDFYKINIESLNVAYHLIRLLVENLSPDEYKSKLDLLHTELLPKFRANDVDQELKLTLISTIGNMVLYMGHHIPQKQVDDLFTIFLDKTKNENLRPLVFNWLIKILKNNPQLKLDTALQQFTPLILDLLVKHSLHIQYQTLEFLLTIITFCPKAVSGDETRIIETLMTITNEDSLVPLIYDILNHIINHFSINSDILEKTLLETIKVFENSKNSGSALHSIFTFIQNVTRTVEKKKLENLIQNILDFNNLNYNKARCISILAKAAGIDQDLISSCTGKLNSNLEDGMKKNVLICLGEVSLVTGQSNSKLLKVIESMISKSSEELRHNLAVCIGKVGATDPSAFVELITANSSKNLNLAYNFVSIREFLHVISNYDVKTHVDVSNVVSIFKILVLNAKDEDEKLRILCGECLGLISLLNEDILKEYLNYLKDEDPVVRATFFYGLKYIFNNKFSLDQYLDFLLGLLINGLSDPDIIVKQNAFNSLINFVHAFGVRIKSKYAEISAIFKKEHTINPELIATVDIGGGMKIKNDKGLPIRKAIYSTIKLLLDCIPEKINIIETLQMCLYGLEDHDDIQALCHGCLLKISHLAPEAFIAILDLLVDSFKKKIESLKNVGTQGAKMDSKKLNDLLVNINRLFIELKKVHEIEENPKFVDLSNEIQKLTHA